MDIDFITTTLDFLGTISIGIAALRVHHRVLHEHKIDNRVFRSMKREQKLGIFGIVLIVASYTLKVFL